MLFGLLFQTGKLELFDVAAGVLLEKIDAHEGAIWGLTLAPDKVLFRILLFKRLGLNKRLVLLNICAISNSRKRLPLNACFFLLVR